ncbi:MAG: tetratricopeptide repeat protein [Acidobacteria bacterium]|nr:tetratricopeptide repeat protein [Acidobacteriota bacterium]
MPKKVSLIAGLVVVGLLVTLGIRAVVRRSSSQEVARQEMPALDQRATPADREIRAAQGMIDREPKLSRGYNLLASAYMQKARETGDFGYNARAEEALNRSFIAEPDNHVGTRLQAYLLLSFHRFAEALPVAQRAVAQSPKDYEAHGALVDALVELGQYEEAKKAVQTMLDIRPYTASYARASYLRSLYGNTDGAIEAMQMAVQSANPGNPENLAWCLVYLGDELMTAGRRSEAEREYDRALFSFPDYYLALAAKARAKVAAGDTDAAVELYKRAQERVPSPDVAVDLGDLYTKLGRMDDAKKQYDLVEFIERTSAASGTYSRQLALFYADREIKLDEALTIARRERETRSDIYTYDALAWVLYKRGELAEAKKSIDEAMRLGTRDARIFYHAGMIYKAIDDPQTAAKYLKLALAINPSFDVLQADVAKQTLHKISA